MVLDMSKFLSVMNLEKNCLNETSFTAQLSAMPEVENKIQKQATRVRIVRILAKVKLTISYNLLVFLKYA